MDDDNDLKSYKLHVLVTMTYLPWKPGQEIDLEKDRVVETVDHARNKAIEKGLREEGLLQNGDILEDMEIDKRLIPLIEKRIAEKLGSWLMCDFDNISEVIRFTDEALSQNLIAEIEAENDE